MFVFLKMFPFIFPLSVAAVFIPGGMAAEAGVRQGKTIIEKDVPVSPANKALLSAYDSKYIFKIKSNPSQNGIANKTHHDYPVPTSITLDLAVLNDPYYQHIDFDRARLLKKGQDGQLTPVVFGLWKTTQSRCVLSWNSVTTDDSVYYFCVPGKRLGKKYPPRLDMPLFMDGGLLRTQGPYRLGSIYYPNYFDINNDGKKDLVTGAFHDFIRVFENIADSPDDVPLFSENHSYVLADRNGQEICHEKFSHCWQVSTPVFYDFNQDGKTDILMGGTLGATDVWYVENVGTNQVPIYQVTQKLKLKCADGYKRGLYPVPCDLNGDGRLDLVAGSITPGAGNERFVYYFEGLSKSAADFKFKDGVRLQDHAGVIRVPGYSQCAVEVFDWDNDGLEDLFVASAGNLFYWKNRGSKAKPRFVPETFPEIAVAGRGSLSVIPGKHNHDIISGSTATYNKNNHNNSGFTEIPFMMLTPGPLTFSGHGTFKVLDWNNDGKDDIIYSTDWGEIVCAVNDHGSWSQRIKLKSSGKPISLYGCVDPGENNKGYARMAIADLDGDGLPDLLVNHDTAWRFGYLGFYKNIGNGEFAAEKSLNLPRTNELEFRQGVKDQAIVFNDKTILDYLSYPAEGIFDHSGGEISFNFSPESDTPWRKPMCLFHNQSFQFNGNKIEYGDEFGIWLKKDGEILWRAGKSELGSSPFKWHNGQWYKLSLVWNDQGMKILLDGKTLAENSAGVFQKTPGPRVYVGAPQTIGFIQPEREVPSRVQLHKHEYETFFPCRGIIDEFKIKNHQGQDLFLLPFDGDPDGIAPQLNRKVSGGTVNIAYRAAPALADPDGDGLVDLILPISENPNSRHPLPSYIYWFKNCGTKTQPQFARGILLPSDDGSGIVAGTRSATRFIDWDGDGDLDMFLVKTGGVIQYYANVGTSRKPRYQHQGTIIKQWWGHESGIDVIDWNKDGQLEVILMNGDNGNLLFYSKPFLDKLSPEPELQEIIGYDRVVGFSPRIKKSIPIPVASVLSDRKDEFVVKNICDGILEGGSNVGWWLKGFPGEVVFTLKKQEKISRIDCYFGHPAHAKLAGGDRCPKSYLFEYWDGSAWKALFPKVEAGPNGNGKGIDRTASFSFPERKTDKIRLKIYSSYDKNPSVPENKRAAFIREIEFFNSPGTP